MDNRNPPGQKRTAYHRDHRPVSATLFDALTSTAEIHTPSELEMLNNVAEGVTFIGRRLYLLVVFKQ